MTESANIEPLVIDTIERYFDLLQAHVSATQMLKEVLTDDFETGFPTAFVGGGQTGCLSSSTHGRCSSMSRMRFCS
jgi:hypothetical protein